MPTMFVIPGWAPLPKIVELPFSQAFRMRSRSSGVCLPPVIQAALEHTLTPDSSSRVELVDVRPQRVVATRVGFQGDQRVDVVGGLDTGGFRPAGQFGGVHTDLVGAVGVDAD